MEIEQLKEATTPDEMRAEINRLRQKDAMVRSVLDMADWKGLSAEDRYAILAYLALRERAKMQKLILDGAMLRPMPPIFVTPNVEFSGAEPLAGGASAGTQG
jgi:hypothetical protein